MGKKNDSIRQIADEIDPNRSLWDYIGNKENDKLTEYEKTIKAQFNAKIREIQNFPCEHCKPDFEGYRIDCGELLVIINKQLGYVWNKIPWGKMETVLEWVVNNHHRKIRFLDKGYHYGVMEMENNLDAVEYQQWYNKHGSINHDPN